MLKKEKVMDTLYGAGWTVAQILVGLMVLGFLFCIARIIAAGGDVAVAAFVAFGGELAKAIVNFFCMLLNGIALLIVALVLLFMCAMLGEGFIDPIRTRWYNKRRAKK
jgi:hypothetical protein